MSRYLNWSFIAFALLLVASATLEAQVKPFKISGSGAGLDGLPLPGQPARDHWVIGEATHLGRHYGEGTVQTASAEFVPPNQFAGLFGSGSPFTFTGANGDQLVCDYGRDELDDFTGEFELTIVGTAGADLIVVAHWIAEFVPRGAECTGKFAGVTGSWTMYAESEPFVLGSSEPVYYTWEGEGKLTFAK